MTARTARTRRAPGVGIIFVTVLIDLVGFGMVVPLVGLYGRHYGASGFSLAFLGGVYSLCQFFAAPFWGSLSDRIGRRPVILLSLLGSTSSYLVFALAPNLTWLIAARALGGIFAGNISAAQAYIADVTTPAERARGMGLIGAAFGIGFTLGPPLGGISSSHLGLPAPGLIAAAICGLNALAALVRLPESLPAAHRTQASTRGLRWLPVTPSQVLDALSRPRLAWLFFTFFFVTFSFSNMEQTFSLLFQSRFGFSTGDSGLKTGLVLMVAGLLGAIVQGSLIRGLVTRFGEARLLVVGLALEAVSLAVFPWGPTYASYFWLVLPMSLGSALVNPTVSSLISQEASREEQGRTLGLSQALGSLARATGPVCGLLSFEYQQELPYLIGMSLCAMLAVGSVSLLVKPR